MLPSSFKNSPVLKNRIIAAVDDDPDILSTIGIMMRSAGIRSVLIGNPGEALEKLPDVRPDLILLDYMMPGMNGAELFEKMVSDDRNPHLRQIPVIMLTAKTDNYEEQQDLLKKGISAYLLKPFGFNELINVMSNVLVLQEARNENRRLNGELLRAKNYLQTLFDSIDDCISVQDRDFRVRGYNRSAAKMIREEGLPEPRFNPESPDVTPFRCHEKFFGFASPCPFCMAKELLNSGQPRFIETVHPETDRHYQISLFPVLNAEGRVGSFIETIRDITEKKKMESHLIESARLAGIGTLATGVAHEINNPLCIIIGFAQSLLKSLAPDNPMTDDLRIIEEESRRCANIVQDLLAYAKPGPMNRQPSDIREILRNSLALMRHQFQKKEILITESYDPSLPLLTLDPKKIQQVVINILLNAIDSVSANGQIRITVSPSEPAGMLSVVIEDNGCGIEDTLLPRVFDPFVSTKFGQGTGLGLSICRTIVQDHGGFIHIRSRKNSGTAVTIHLPIEGNPRGTHTRSG